MSGFKMKKIASPLLVILLVLCTTIPSLPKEENNPHHIKILEFSKPPEIDGKLENPLWEKGAILDEFTQYEPQEGGKPSEKTVAYIGYDQENLYIAVRCFDSDPKAIRSCLAQRDKIYTDDGITIYLDTFNDKKRAFAFHVNPCGVQTDGIHTENRRRGRGRGGGGGGLFGFDRSWDTFFLSDAQIDDQGYTVEMSIPFKSLRFPNSQPQIWGVQVKREIRRKNEEIYWAPRSRDINGFLVQAGTMEIDGKIEKGKNLEVMPVFTGLKQDLDKLDPEYGMNFKYGITSDMTSDLTFNPDFSQVEADMPQIDVNQRYALYYSEKRPFFLEGKDFFDAPFELVYTRKIVNPQWGTKITGKIGKTTLGFLSAYDESPTEIDIPGNSEDTELEYTKAIINIFRLKRDLHQESYVGFIFTDKEAGYAQSSLFKDYNRVVGIDGHFKFQNYYRFSFQILGSQSKVENDKTGFVPATSFNFSRNSRHLRASIDYNSVPEDFEASTGYFRRKDIQSISSRVSYAILPMNDIIVDIRPSFEYRRIYDFENTLTDEQFNLTTSISGWRGSNIWTTFSSSLERYEGIDFRKKTYRAVFMSQPLSWIGWILTYSFGDSIYYDENPYLGYKTSFGVNGSIKPMTNFSINYNIKRDIFSKSRGGEKVYTINIISQRLTYQFSRALSLRLITDYNDYYSKFYTSVLLSYEYRPGTVLYLGIDDNQEKDDLGRFRMEGRYYFIKFSYWWRM